MEDLYNSVIESLIFASDDPITPEELVAAIKGIDGEDAEIHVAELDERVDILNKKFAGEDYSFRIIALAGGYVFATKPEYSKYIGYLSSEKSKRKLSQAALETLAIIAYKQPVTKPEIESIRGVQSDYILGTLLEKNLIAIKGRSEAVGRPLLYETTEEFLKYFGLNCIADLPRPRELEEILQDEDIVEQRRKLLIDAVEESFEFEFGESELND